jgi:iron complex outermembrane receptor protein
LNVTLASRYSDFSTVGDTTNSKAGLEWRPIEQLLFRATWAEGFRAPTITNLYAGGSQTFAFYTDPCDPVYGVTASNPEVAARCDADIADFANFRQLQQGFVPAVQSNAQTPVAFFANAANPLLEPEESVSKTAGVVWTPEAILDGLQVSLDWWTVRIENTIVTDTPNLILNDCYVQGLPARCGLFTRDAALGYVNTMSYGFRNAGYRYVEGYDLDLLYTFDTGFGEFTVSSRTTYLTDDELKSTNDAVVVPTENIGFADSAGTTHEVRSIAGLEWSLENWGVTWNARYYSGLTEACLSNTSYPEYCSDPQTPGPIPTTLRDNNELGSNTFHDVQVRWEAPWEATIALGANNVFDHLGQQMYSQPNANVSYNGEFDIGRSIYVRYQQNW